MEPIRIVLADDHSLMRNGTRHLLEQQSDMVVVGEAEDGQQALELVERLQPDVAILDIRMPKLNGIQVLQQMSQRSSTTKTLILTAYDDDDYILALMNAGASGYLLKTIRTDELIDAVRRVHLGEAVLHPAVAIKVARLWARQRESARQEFPEGLSVREREVLELVAKGLRNKAIADKLSISARTVEGHLTSIFSKLGISSRIEAVLYALSHHIAVSEEGDST